MKHELLRLTQEWRWLLDPDIFILLEVSPFGDLFLRDSSGAYCLLDVNGGELVYATEAGSNPAVLFPELFDGSIALDYVQAGLLPADGECFAYITPSVAGGGFQSSNVRVASITEYLDFMGKFHYDIHDIPDGATTLISKFGEPSN